MGGVLRLVFDTAALHIGPMRVEEGDVFGGTVNFAARVVGAVQDAEIWLSERAKEDIDRISEARMANDERMTKHENPKPPALSHERASTQSRPATVGYSSLGIRASFGIRHLNFGFGLAGWRRGSTSI